MRRGNPGSTNLSQASSMNKVDAGNVKWLLVYSLAIVIGLEIGILLALWKG